jgi:hypothetical protein
MMCTMKRYVALLGLCVLAGVATASAQVTYQITSVPTFVIQTGDSEVLGSVRLTATNTGPTIASTIEFLFPGVSCDNDFNGGMTLGLTGVYATAGNVVPSPSNSGAVVNTGGGCTVSITVKGGLSPALGPPADHIELGGVRARMELTSVPLGGSVNSALFAAPSNSSLFTAPSTVVVASPQPGLVVGITGGLALLCISEETAGEITLTEGYNGAFVQNVPTAAGSIIPASARPRFGASNNTQFRIVVGPIPAGVSLTFPAAVDGTAGAFTAGSAGDEIQLLSSATITGPTAGNTTILYEYACGNQAVCDTTLESFTIDVGIGATATSTIGSVVAQAELNPRETVPGPAFTDPPNPGVSGVLTVPSPRFSDALQPTPAATLATIAPCTTTLLFPWVVSNVAQFDTGIAIANTSVDPFTAVVEVPTPPEHGTCTLTGFPKGEGAPVSLTTADISAGDTYTAVLSSTVFSGFEGYLIARCNFQFGHGFAFLSNNFGTGMPPTVGQGYVALIIPDPQLIGRRFAFNSDSFRFFPVGEQLDQ